jgi:hypothetical protein
MDRHLADWKYELDRFWSAHAPDYGEAIQLAREIASTAENETLSQAASQALPILRSAAEAGADHAICAAARRRLNVISEVISALTTPQFGRRAAMPKALSAEDRSRELLGLPLGRSLSESEIHRAYKLLAKRTHPDAGGSGEAFLRISAAHEALIRERRMPPRQ